VYGPHVSVPLEKKCLLRLAQSPPLLLGYRPERRRVLHHEVELCLPTLDRKSRAGQHIHTPILERTERLRTLPSTVEDGYIAVANFAYPVCQSVPPFKLQNQQPSYSRRLFGHVLCPRQGRPLPVLIPREFDNVKQLFQSYAVLHFCDCPDEIRTF